MWNAPQEPDKKCPDPFADKVKCDECLHWIDKSDSTKMTSYTGFGSVDYHYCPMHKKPYSSRHSFGFSMTYYGKVKMTEDGTPVGYEKIKTK